MYLGFRLQYGLDCTSFGPSTSYQLNCGKEIAQRDERVVNPSEGVLMRVVNSTGILRISTNENVQLAQPHSEVWTAGRKNQPKICDRRDALSPKNDICILEPQFVTLMSSTGKIVHGDGRAPLRGFVLYLYQTDATAVMKVRHDEAGALRCRRDITITASKE